MAKMIVEPFLNEINSLKQELKNFESKKLEDSKIQKALIQNNKNTGNIKRNPKINKKVEHEQSVEKEDQIQEQMLKEYQKKVDHFNQ